MKLFRIVVHNDGIHGGERKEFFVQSPDWKTMEHFFKQLLWTVDDWQTIQTAPADRKVVTVS